MFVGWRDDEFIPSNASIRVTLVKYAKIQTILVMLIGSSPRDLWCVLLYSMSTYLLTSNPVLLVNGTSISSSHCLKTATIKIKFMSTPLSHDITFLCIPQPFISHMHSSSLLPSSHHSLLKEVVWSSLSSWPSPKLDVRPHTSPSAFPSLILSVKGC